MQNKRMKKVILKFKFNKLFALENNNKIKEAAKLF